ncbi:hypothetical protein EDB86DRAFT_3202463 [Lactarius hatsudake]|nr:hypothetical protein EDB86DRAFT_3202463 [Lactarius hatsudake]
MSVSALAERAEPSPSPTGTVSISVSASATPSLSPSAPPTVPSPSFRAPSSTTVSSPILTPERSQVALTRTPSSVSTASSISLGSDILDNRSLFEGPILEDVPTEPSLLSTHRTTVSRPISPVNIPLPRTPSLLSTPTASASVSMSSPHGSTPSAYSDLLTIPSEVAPTERAPSERARSERPPSEGPSVIITDDINRLLQYLHGVENDRQRDNQGVHDHLGEIQNELRNLADYMHEKEVPQVVPPPPVHLKDRSIEGSSVVSFGGPRGAPDYPSIPPTVTGKASPGVIAIPLTPPPRSPRSPSSLSSSISFLSSHHSDDSSLLGSEPLESEPLETELFETEPDVPRESSSSISSSPISYSPPSSAVPTTPGIDCEVINRICDVLDAVKGQTDALWDGQLSTNHVLDKLRQRVPRTQDNTELVERLQRLEDLINRLADAQARARAPSPPPESLFDSGSDTSTAIRRLRERPRTSLDDMMAELLRPPQPTVAVLIQPPPTFVPLNFRPDARGPRPRSASPTLLGDLPPLQPFTLPIPEHLITRDIGCLEPSSFVAKQGLDQIALSKQIPFNRKFELVSKGCSTHAIFERLRQQDCLPLSGRVFGCIRPVWIGREYATADTRWGIADPTAVSLEPLTVRGAGPLAVFIVYRIVQRDPTRALLDRRAQHGEALRRGIESVAHLDAPNKHRQTLQTCRLGLRPFFKTIRVCAIVRCVTVEAGEMGLRAALVWKTSAKPGAGMGAAQDCRRVRVADEPVLPGVWGLTFTGRPTSSGWRLNTFASEVRLGMSFPLLLFP